MNLTPNAILYFALVCYALGTVAALASLVIQEKRLQRPALVFMVAGFLAHTVFIGTICTKTGHPPITNLPETTSFVAWVIFAVELALYIRYRVHAASFFVYPLVLGLLTTTAIVQESFAPLAPALRSRLFTAHLLFSTVGVAALLIGMAFSLLAWLQDRALKSKRRGALWEWIPSLNVCRLVSFRATAVGFAIYTLGILTGILWSYKTTAELMAFSAKETGALVAWVLFGVILQSNVTGSYRGTRAVVVSVGAFVAVLVAILGISHG